MIDKGEAAVDVDETEIVENERFNRQFNKQLELSKDQVPGVINEFLQNAYVFIKKSQYERALTLLAKAYGLTDIVPEVYANCRRDRFTLFVMFHNMAVCY